MVQFWNGRDHSYSQPFQNGTIGNPNFKMFGIPKCSDDLDVQYVIRFPLCLIIWSSLMVLCMSFSFHRKQIQWGWQIWKCPDFKW